MKKEIIEMIKGAYDLHVHSFPSHIKRKMNDFELIKKAKYYEMAGVMIKNHYESTAARASLLNDYFKFSTKAYGGIVLNTTVGGINPYAVESSMKLGAKFIWLPTRDAFHCLKFGNMKGDFFDREGIKLIRENKNKKLIESFYQVLEVIARYNGVLATGHISIEEARLVCREAISRGIKTVLTHPDWNRTKYSLEEQKEFAKMGVKIEKVWANLEDGDCEESFFINSIREIGVENIFLTTDRGQYDKKDPIESYLNFIEFLLKNGFSNQEIKIMTTEVPKKLIS